MKKIKLAILALALVCGSVGAYGKFQKRLQLYYVVSGISSASTEFPISPSSPSINCFAGDIGYVCTVQAEDALPNGYPIPSQDATIVTVYDF